MRAVVSLVISACVFVFSLTGLAVAVPPTGPMSIVSHGFETTPTAPAWEIRAFRDTAHPSAAFWGRMSNVQRTDTFSLWCAGTRRDGAPNTWGRNYPAQTKGIARLNLPELANFYSSEVSFFYTMPSVGVADFFTFRFGTDVPPLQQSTPITDLTGSNAWIQRNFKLSSTFGEVNLSRTPGYVWFQFFDSIEGEFQRPPRGQGPSIDDVTITGYKYGPVRNLSASTTSTAGVTLRWARPHRSTAATSTEERVVNYMIWRRPLGTATWTEVTRVGNDATSWQDTTAIADMQYEYLVYAVDPLPGTGWGKFAANVMGVRPSSAIAAFTMTPNFLTLEHRWPVTLSYRIQNISVGTTISGITLRDSFGDITGAGVPATLGPGQSAIIQRVRFPAASGNVTATLGALSDLGAVDTTVGAFITRKAPPARVSGADRLSTALKVANQAYPPGGARNVIIATGWDYPDALSASALAGVKDGPVLLVNRTSAT
ncbi:MAG: cell wall-binding repeat-containing protein, partial [Actinobacteria bacterium]|nr:cell wall-binding repeat-containing protein [Actinomycetota bacterium]